MSNTRSPNESATANIFPSIGGPKTMVDPRYMDAAQKRVHSLAAKKQ